MVSGDPQVQSAAQSAAAGPVELDDSAAPMSLEVAQLENDPITTDTFSYMAREYIWGPGDNGVDELLVQFDENRYPWWIAQDGGGDFIAEMATGSGSGATSLAAQWTYDAYGQVIGVQRAAWGRQAAGAAGEEAGHECARRRVLWGLFTLITRSMARVMRAMNTTMEMIWRVSVKTGVAEIGACSTGCQDKSLA